MLLSLSIGDVVLIHSVDISFDEGLCVLTGETGAGKSILLDSLGLALGMRASASLVRSETDSKDEETKATVVATFSVDDHGPLRNLLEEHAIIPPSPGEPLVLRRLVEANGRSRAFVNDQPVGALLLRRVGELLVEIEGQFASQGLMDETTHRATLDGFSGLSDASRTVAEHWHRWRDTEEALANARAKIEAARRDEDYLRHAAAELAELDPQPDEEQTLADSRTILMQGEKLIETLTAAEKSLTNRDGVDSRIDAALRTLTRQGAEFGSRLDPVLSALELASDNVAEAMRALRSLMIDSAPDPSRLENCEERLFALRAAARKHNVSVEILPRLRAELEERIAALEDTSASLKALEVACTADRRAYIDTATALSECRSEHAAKLDAAVGAELPALKLEKARFVTQVERQDESGWGPAGFDHVRFEVATNPGMASGPLAKIASGGELARFLLALKVVLQEAHGVPTLVFDEVDSGLGGAAAAAVGKRLARLAKKAQVLVVTHSPQVAAFGGQHLRVAKSNARKDTGGNAKGGTVTIVEELSVAARQEEIARMLAGARVTDEARAAAARLMAGSGR